MTIFIHFVFKPDNFLSFWLLHNNFGAHSPKDNHTPSMFPQGDHTLNIPPPKWSCSSTCPPKVIIFLQPYPKSGHTPQPSSKSGQAYPSTFPKKLPYLFHFTPKLTLPPIISSKAIMPFKIHPKTNHAPEHSPQKWSYPSALTPKVTTPHQPSPKRDHAPSTNHGPSIYHCLWSITTLQVWECSFASIQKWKTNHVWFWLVLLCLKHVCNTYQAPLCPFQSAVGKTTTVLTHTSVSIELDLGRQGIPCDQNSFPNRSNPYQVSLRVY